MAKVSMINREKKRTKLVAKYAAKRAELKATHYPIRTWVSRKSRMRCSLCRNCLVIRVRRASVTVVQFQGVPRGFYRKFGLGRNMLREAAMRGDVPGLRKASW